MSSEKSQPQREKRRRKFRTQNNSKVFFILVVEPLFFYRVHTWQTDTHTYVHTFLMSGLIQRRLCVCTKRTFKWISLLPWNISIMLWGVSAYIHRHTHACVWQSREWEEAQAKDNKQTPWLAATLKVSVKRAVVRFASQSFFLCCCCCCFFHSPFSNICIYSIFSSVVQIYT